MIFNNMCEFWEREECRSGIESFSCYIYVGTRKYQDRLLNPTHLERITGYIIEDAVGDRDLKKLSQKKSELNWWLYFKLLLYY